MGDFQFWLVKINFRRLSTNIVDMIEKVVNTDMVAIKNFTFENQTNSNRDTKISGTAKCRESFTNNLAKYLKTSPNECKKIF